ncbi:hypothetical protein DPEC_G00331900 [Dallia pectoralis]|uniref:Uncharacterized protein n=1 Tax=Dallia pectoralis TaxID=75939 RepID=A0ACC2F633_DALPE|nr:hypothetical protein DPEC_G00331900 [Dallia pectoralis]
MNWILLKKRPHLACLCISIFTALMCFFRPVQPLRYRTYDCGFLLKDLGWKNRVVFPGRFTSDPAAAVAPGSDVPHSDRCHGESLRAIKKTLLRDLNLKQEPQVEADRLTAIRKQWKTAFNAISHKTLVKTAPPQAKEPGPETSVGLQCCQLAEHITLKDLGWENWVIYPESFTYVHCSLCNSQLGSMRCISQASTGQVTPSEKPCCQATSQEYVPILFMDEYNALTISSVQLIRTCGCSPDNPELSTQD